MRRVRKGRRSRKGSEREGKKRRKIEDRDGREEGM